MPRKRRGVSTRYFRLRKAMTHLSQAWRCVEPTDLTTAQWKNLGELLASIDKRMQSGEKK